MDKNSSNQFAGLLLAEEIREFVKAKFLEPARCRGEKYVSFTAKDIHKSLDLTQRFPSVCGAIDAEKFQDEYRVQLIARKGPRHSCTVAWKFEIL